MEAAAAGPAGDRESLSSWQDIDLSLAEYCAAEGLPLLEGIEESVELHFRAMTEWREDLETRPGADG